jgi:hypothetical protein
MYGNLPPVRTSLINGDRLPSDMTVSSVIRTIPSRLPSIGFEGRVLESERKRDSSDRRFGGGGDVEVVVSWERVVGLLDDGSAFLRSVISLRTRKGLKS